MCVRLFFFSVLSLLLLVVVLLFLECNVCSLTKSGGCVGVLRSWRGETQRQRGTGGKVDKQSVRERGGTNREGWRRRESGCGKRSREEWVR